MGPTPKLLARALDGTWGGDGDRGHMPLGRLPAPFAPLVIS